MWDQRYNVQEYIYGTKPNDFLKDNVSVLSKGSFLPKESFLPKGKLLSLAEGEGRNAVYLAKLGFQVTAVDSSSVGINKAKQLAKENKVDIEFIQSDLGEFNFGNEQWDNVISIFCPLPASVRQAMYKKIERALKPKGIFLLEAYRPEQIHNETGGGKDPETMQTASSLRKELANLAFYHLVETEREVLEGSYHTGKGAVVQAIAQKL